MNTLQLVTAWGLSGCLMLPLTAIAASHSPCASLKEPKLNYRRVGLIKKQHPFEERNVMNPAALLLKREEVPAALVRELNLPVNAAEQFVFMLYRAETKNLKSSIGIAWSTDGVNFHQHHRPIYEGLTKASLAEQIARFPERQGALEELYRAEATGGAEDPRIVQIKGEDGVAWYYLTYTAHDVKAPEGEELSEISAPLALHMARLALARSRDLVDWERIGIVFAEPPIGETIKNGEIVPPPQNGWSKAGVILPQKLHGKYWMLFGDTSMFWATSPDLEHWRALAEPVLAPRQGHPDERQVETSWGIQLLAGNRIEVYYNGSNWPEDGGVYGLYLAHIDQRDMRSVVFRSPSPILRPELPEELEGEVDNVVFTEGRVCLNGQNFFYYGAGDREIGVASDQPLPELNSR